MVGNRTPKLEDESDEFDFLALWQVIVNGKRVVALAIVVCALIAVVVAITATQSIGRRSSLLRRKNAV